MVGTRSCASARASSKAERAAVVEVLEGKAAAAFSKTVLQGDEKPPRNPKPKKDRALVRVEK